MNTETSELCVTASSAVNVVFERKLSLSISPDYNKHGNAVDGHIIRG
jgi:hypothetical protein